MQSDHGAAWPATPTDMFPMTAEHQRIADICAHLRGARPTLGHEEAPTGARKAGTK